MNIKENIRRILREDKYSPAGKEIIPNSIVVHKSNPIFRDNIMSEGLKVKDGECYKIYVGYGTKCKPAIFATNSINERAWFDSTYDDDIWEINTEMIPDVKWYKDRHFESIKKHIVTFQNIPSEALTLKYEGSGRNDFLEESIRRILREETEVIPSFIKRRIGGYVNNILLVYSNYNLTKGNFKNLIDEISDVLINDLLSDYIDSIGYTVDDEDDNYDQSVVDKIYDKYYNLLKDHIQGNYSDEIYKLYLKNKK